MGVGAQAHPSRNGETTAWDVFSTFLLLEIKNSGKMEVSLLLVGQWQVIPPCVYGGMEGWRGGGMEGWKSAGM